MKKIGILTLNGNYNYGNRLQNYALQEVLKSLDLQCETIINETYIDKNIKLSKFDKYKRFKNKKLSEKALIIYNKINIKIHKKEIGNLEKSRTEIFKKFSKDFINETQYTISLNNIPKDLNEKFDYFICGSDQVWNPNDPMVSEINFMTFTENKKRMTYAPSFGVATLSNKYKEEYKKWLDGIDNISVREEEGAKIIKELTGKDAIVVVDPTMLITSEKWLSISKVHVSKPKEKYLLTYFLGEISKETKQKIRKIAHSNNLQIVNLATLKDKKYYVSGPSEFIDYINDAELFMTDSFHGCVFSLLLETPFIVCDRVGQGDNKINSRIETFLKKFELQSRKFDEVTDKSIFQKKYVQAYKILERERKKSMDFLRSYIV